MCEQFERKEADDGRNLQLSHDRVISDVPRKIGDLTEGSGLVRVQARSNVGRSRDPNAGAAYVMVARRKSR